MSCEIWRPVLGYEQYSVSSLGKIKSHLRINRRGFKIKERILSGTIDADGYLVYTFYGSDGKYKKMHAQRIVALHFIDNALQKPTVNHKDGNKLNNVVSNLEWATHKEQTNHAIKTGLLVFKNGIVFTEEHKRNLSIALKGRVAWNKGLKQKRN